ncbi:MAG TPA: hypothetical protein PLK98_06420, partial [Methanothrix sp.]|nr:hypothetical protein [Methanothrix sp.]
ASGPTTARPSQRREARHPGSVNERKPAPAPAARKLLLLNKPYMVLCQFTDEAGRETLKDYIKEPGIYAAGDLTGGRLQVATAVGSGASAGISALQYLG